MRKILGFLFVIVILGCGGYFVYVNYVKSKVPKLNLEEEVVMLLNIMFMVIILI